MLKSRSKSLILSFVVGMFLCVVSVSGSEAAQNETALASRPVRLDLGFAQSPPESHVQIPLTLALPRGTQIGSVTNEITFPTELLSFQEAIKGLSVEIAEAEVATEVHPDEDNPENSILTVTIVGKAGGMITRGVLVDLVFVISKQAQLGETLILRNTASALSPGASPQPLDPVTGNDGEILIDKTAVVFACFFYMH
jgi:hypothetical protein